ncbi:hypothetical protein VOLCADRAFT_98026 [Volvox carteri f. nagariensis]|uniref:Uncharacterized protein n=1 Tax=Volvox carteri f. nagariensis TaxID=3068 RepID=D8UE92_VOLCA|nr:uncharacterized protein VOLCADRAFT_98026 [Volvox carteri f. nagariensis]EFJ41965.1 hypothetical protein VOLCADRAFT_98026 [Volvox carteri f. nagariensis]|eukprot:XP_002957002.1 hypothetical protein VOLCADRAFT_98026 [Volvox carteri f. nagariensis]
MEATGQSEGQGQDPQRLLANLAAEYTRSRRFLEELENSFVRETSPGPPSRPTYPPAEDHDEPNDQLATAPNPREVGHKKPPESAPSNLRSKLRSFFSRRALLRNEAIPEPSVPQALIRPSSESQSTIPGRRYLSPSTTMVSERQIPASSPVRRTSQVCYTTGPAETVPRTAPRAPASAAADAGGRPATARRSSIVYVSGDAMDSTSQGWIARVACPDTGDRPATGRRTSIVFYADSSPTTGATPGRSAAGSGCAGPAVGVTGNIAGGGSGGGGSSGGTTAGEHPIDVIAPAAAAAAASGRVRDDSNSDQFRHQHNGENGTGGAGAAAAGNSRRNLSVHSAVGVGSLQDTADPYEFMSLMAGPRRTTSFQHRSGTKLQPTAQRLRSAVSTRRTSIEAYCNRELAQPPPPPPPQQQHPPLLQQQPRLQGSRASFEALCQPVMSTTVDQASTTVRRTGSLEIPRPYSAVPRNHSAAAAAVVPTAVNISNSTLFAPASISGYTAPVAAVPATATAAAAAAAVPNPPQAAAAAAAAVPGPRMRVLHHQSGVAWAAPAALSPTGSTGSSTGPMSPSDAAAVLTVGRIRTVGGGGGGGGPAIRTSMSSLNSKRLLDLADIAQQLMMTASASASAAYCMGGVERPRAGSGSGMIDVAAAAAAAAPPSPPAAAVRAARGGPALHIHVTADGADEAAAAAVAAAAATAATAAAAPSPNTSPTGRSNSLSPKLAAPYTAALHDRNSPPPFTSPPPPTQPHAPPQVPPQPHNAAAGLPFLPSGPWLSGYLDQAYTVCSGFASNALKRVGGDLPGRLTFRTGGRLFFFFFFWSFSVILGLPITTKCVEEVDMTYKHMINRVHSKLALTGWRDQ